MSDVIVDVPWGTMYGKKGAWFAAAIDPATPDELGNDFYLVDDDAMKRTYELAK